METKRQRLTGNVEAKQALDELKTRERDSRFRELLDLADEGNQDAIGDLYREYGYDYDRGVA